MLLAIIAMALGAAIILEGLLIGYFSSQRKEQQTRADVLAGRVSELEAEGEEAKKREREGRERMRWFRMLFNNTNDMVLAFSITEDSLPGRFLEVNDTACAWLGRTREEILQMTPMDIEYMETPVASLGYSKSDLVVLSDSYVKDQYMKVATRAARHYVEQILEHGNMREERIYQDKNGRKMPVEVVAQRFVAGNRTMVMCTASDITKRKQAEVALSESRQRFRDFFASSPIGIAMFDGKRELVDVNQACLKMFGIPDKDQFALFNMFDNPFISPDAKKSLNAGESVRDEWVVDFNQAIQKSLFVTSRVGLAYFDIMLNNMGLDREYRPRGYAALVQDVSDRRKAEMELEKAEVQLRQAEKMEAIGSMAGGIAHDFNNILTPIVGYAKMLLRVMDEKSPSFKYVQGIQKAGARAKELVAQILTFSRKSDTAEHQDYKPIHVIPIVKEVLQLQRTAFPKEIEINRTIKTEYDVVAADPTRLHQVMMNLTTNAWHAMRDKGGPAALDVILTDFVIDQRGKNTEFPQLAPGRYLRISVKDSGTGIPPHVQKRMFEPFFTTKKAGDGTGMGLAVVHGMITALKGGICFDTEVGKGTTFHVVLPAVESSATEEASEKDVVIPSGSECILVVDDEHDVLEVLASMLASIGYRPIAAASGEDALKLFQQSPEQFDLVIADQVMPRMTGLEVARKILEIRKNVPIILSYAYAEEITIEEARAAGVNALLDKPISLENMAAVIRRILDEKNKAASGAAKK